MKQTPLWLSIIGINSSGGHKKAPQDVQKECNEDDG
jgi:hypothetical protein|tara:strand:+ start:843 stop:950 length:108 start_codon:yes stop_codon:yes gene_type:complete